MPSRAQRHGLPAILVLLLALGCNKETPTQPGGTASGTETGDLGFAKGPAEPFDEAEVFFEFNTSDNDLGLQVFLDADGWTKVDLSDPGNHVLFHIMAHGELGKLGITEFRFESDEPSPPEVLAAFPPGTYTFRGNTIEEGKLLSTATLSHDFLPAPTLSPSDGDEVDPANTVVTWSAPGADLVEIIIENEDLGHIFDVILPGAGGSLNVPPQFLQPGTEYAIEILAISPNGNRTIVESDFVTAP